MMIQPVSKTRTLRGTFLVFGWLMLLVGVACSPVTGVSEKPDGGSYDCSATSPADLAQLYDHYFASSQATGCSASGCHGTGAGGLTFRNAEELWAASVGQSSALKPDQELIKAGDPAHSLLFQRISPRVSGRMPQGGPYLDDAALSQIAGWICAGAPRPEARPDAGGSDGGIDAGVEGPVVTGLDPSSGVVGTEIAILGSGFPTEVSAVVVAFNGSPATVTQSETTTIHAVVPSDATSGLVTVTIYGQTATSPTAFEVIQLNPVPVLRSMTPVNVTAGSASINLQISGDSFVSLSTVELDGSALPTQFQNASQLNATVSAALLALAATHTVTVTTPGPGGGTSSGAVFIVENPVPTISSLTPSSVMAGSGDLSLSVNGTGFTPETTVLINGTGIATTFVSSSELQVVVSHVLLATGGSIAITVSNPLPGGGIGEAASLVVTNPLPTLTQVSPSSVTAGSGETLLALTGSGFIAGTVATVEGTTLMTSVLSPTSLTASLPSAFTSAAGVHAVGVRTPAPGGGSSETLQVTVRNPAPVVTGLSPSSVAVGTPGIAVTISGSQFVPGLSVTVDGTPVVASLQGSSAISISIPASLLAGTGGRIVAVTNPAPGGGTASATLDVRNPAPVLSSITPTSALAGAEIVLTARGSGFVNTSNVTVDGFAQMTSLIDSGTLTATIPAGTLSVGSHHVAVVTPAPGGGTSSTVSLNIQNPIPSVTSLSPASLPLGNTDATVTVNGAGFVSSSSATLDSSPVGVIFVSSTELLLSIPASARGALGTHSIVVTNAAPGGGSSTSILLAIVNPAPSITSIAPATYVAGNGGVNLAVTGVDLVSGASVSIDGASLPTTITGSVASATLDAAVTAVGANHTITITNPGPGGGTSAGVTWVVTNPAPTLASINPSNIGTNGAPFSLMVTGTGFNAASVVNLQGTAVSTTLISSTTLLAAIPSVASVGNYPITVVTPTPGGGTTSAINLVATAGITPTITGLAPSVAESNQTFTLTITGSGFSCSGQTSDVLVDGTSYTPATCSSTQLTVSLPALAVGSYSIVVKNQSRTSNSVSLSVTDPNPVPVIASLTPSTALAGSAATTVTVDGTSFISSSSVLFNGTARTTTFVSPTRLTAILTSSDLSTAASASISVRTPVPGGGSSSSLPFVIVTPNPTPFLESVQPSLAASGAGPITVVLSGTAFVTGAIAALDGSARSTTVISSTSLSVELTTTDTATAATHTLTVTNPAPGGGTSAGINFSVADPNPLPSISSLSPEIAGAGGAAFSLSVFGAFFVQGATVLWGGTARSTQFVSSTQLVAQIAANDIAAVGDVPIAVMNPTPGGGTSSSLTFSVVTPNPLPTLTAISPAVVELGSGASSVALSGTGFLAHSSGSFNGSPRTTHYESPTQLTVDLLSSDLATEGTFPIAVTNPAPGGGTSANVTLTLQAPNPLPSIATLSPSAIATGSGETPLTVTGANFVAASVVSLNGRPKTTSYLSPTQVSVLVPSVLLASAGSISVSVTNPAPGGGTSGTLILSVAGANPAPSISGLSPSTAATGTSGLSVTISGSGFIPESTVTFGGNTRTAQYTSSSELSVDLTTADLASSGSFPVVVMNPAPGGGVSNAFSLTIVTPNPLPAIGSLSPTSVTVGSASQTLTVSGTGFVSGSVIAFNGIGKTTSFVSATQLTATLSTSDLATAGTFGVVVTSPAPGGGSSGSSDFFVNNPAPTISSLSPTSITVGASAQSLTVNGTGFVSGSTVTVDGSARTTHYVNSTRVTADLPASDLSSIGTHLIRVVNDAPGGGICASTTLTIAAQPNPVPSITSLSPCGTVAGGVSFTLTINGTNLISGATATFNGTSVPLTFVSATQATAAVPGVLIATAPASNSVNVIVTNPAPGGGASNSYGFGVAANAATLAGNVQAIFTSNCSTSGCHTGSNAAEGLNLSSGQSYAELVGVNCTQCASRKLVLACGPGPTQSYVVAKIKGSNLCSGSRMPKTGQLTTGEQQTVVDWIAQGAPQ